MVLDKLHCNFTEEIVQIKKTFILINNGLAFAVNFKPKLYSVNYTQQPQNNPCCSGELPNMCRIKLTEKQYE